MPDRNVGNATILIADDSEANSDLLNEILMEAGYRTICVRSGTQALSKVLKGEADLALLDVMMPDQSGFEVCAAIKSNPATRFVPVILVTGLCAADDRIQGIVSGADDFLNKPVNKQEVRARVKSLLRLKSYIDELENAEIVLTTLAASIEAKDQYTHGHCERLSNYSVALGRKLGLSDELCVALRKGGIVHDIGKVAVPERILLKPERLTSEEWYIMKQHPAVGERICAPIAFFSNGPSDHSPPPRKTRWNRLSGRTVRRRNSIDGEDFADRRHLRRDDHRPPVPPSDANRRGFVHHAERSQARLVGLFAHRRIRKHGGRCRGVAH
jgi:response regulator RpfG family c-di-GMP phosphodiesterase